MHMPSDNRNSEDPKSRKSIPRPRTLTLHCNAGDADGGAEMKG